MVDTIMWCNWRQQAKWLDSSVARDAKHNRETSSRSKLYKVSAKKRVFKFWSFLDL